MRMVRRGKKELTRMGDILRRLTGTKAEISVNLTVFELGVITRG
jgi:hypothetical protein